MAIEGLRPVGHQPQDAAVILRGYRRGTPDVAEALDVSLEAMKWMGVVGDEQKTRDSLQGDYQDMAGMGLDGRLYPEVAEELISFEGLLTAAEGKRPGTVQEVCRWQDLWTPGTGDRKYRGYSAAELDAGSPVSEGRLLLFSSENHGNDPALHGLVGPDGKPMPYDDWSRDGAPQTQLELIAARQREFARVFPHRMLAAAGVRTYLVNVLMDRIRGENQDPETYLDPRSERFILNCGFMRLPDLSRRTVDGVSYVGNVFSYVGQLRLDRSVGDADSGVGVGLAAGPQQHPQDACPQDA